ncbi:hypothetical protein JWJ90_06390 [Desulfobulbus rhabdoformis]|uniref:hypothetical protein n=1 Tax=Desulfobulbus rhabdoformis TaxID=34032 RepID=UPI001964A486|nr:hypothetical protein [Desulfobulbus rhabdoformis]MBM9613917.1 hypothetical protein [Desulfobulbus rhabdoformis]
MAKKLTPKKNNTYSAEKGELAMIEGIIEGSPDAVGVAVIRYDCGCRKMAAVNKSGEPASEIIMYRDHAESICDQCKEDNGSYMRMIKQFIYWNTPEPDEYTKKMIIDKVLGTEQ